ncbi:hypothetical protein ACIBCA_16025 [Kitasatospora sp. NPDC051170]|uniref:hypothetical protein n=1 Tax=Kitasatospora sp. NPDC051170 TaxID=3364056 RepID=UPI00379E4BD9
MQSGGAELNLGFQGGRCGGTSYGGAPGRPGRPPIGRLGAAERCEALLQETLDAVEPPLAWRAGAPTAGVRLPRPGRESEPCWYVGRGRDVLTVVSLPRRAELAGAVERHWRRRGWTITGLGDGPARPGVAAATGDGYRLALRFGELGEVRLLAGSSDAACSGHGPVALPEVCCPYWSAPGW